MLDLQVIKDWLGITTSDYDTPLTELRDRLTERIQRRLDWYFGPPRPVVEYLNGQGRPTVFLRQPPVGGVVAMAYRSSPTEWLAYPTDEFFVDNRKVINTAVGFWPYGTRNLRATYEEGFETPPGDIAQLLLDLMQANVTTTSGAAGGNVTSEKLGDYSYTIGSGVTGALELSGHWADVYNSWRRGRI